MVHNASILNSFSVITAIRRQDKQTDIPENHSRTVYVGDAITTGYNTEHE